MLGKLNYKNISLLVLVLVPFLITSFNIFFINQNYFFVFLSFILFFIFFPRDFNIKYFNLFLFTIFFFVMSNLFFVPYSDFKNLLNQSIYFSVIFLLFLTFCDLNKLEFEIILKVLFLILLIYLIFILYLLISHPKILFYYGKANFNSWYNTISHLISKQTLSIILLWFFSILLSFNTKWKYFLLIALLMPFIGIRTLMFSFLLFFIADFLLNYKFFRFSILLTPFLTFFLADIYFFLDYFNIQDARMFYLEYFLKLNIPFLGFGFGSTDEVMTLYQPLYFDDLLAFYDMSILTETNRILATVESSYIKLIIEQGYFFTFLFIFLNVYIIYIFYELKIKSKEKFFDIFTRKIFLIYFFMNVTEDNMFNIYWWLMIFFLFLYFYKNKNEINSIYKLS